LAANGHDGDLHPSPQPIQQPAKATIPKQPTSTTVNQDVPQLAANGHDANAASTKPPLIGPFVPVNSTHETPAINDGAQDSSSGAGGDEISTHKPLGPVSKPPRSPSEDTAGPGAPQATEGKATGDEQVPKSSTGDGAPAPHTGANGESCSGGREPPAGHCAEEEPPQSESQETAQTLANQADSPLSTPANDTCGAKESVTSGVPAPLGAKLAEKSPSAPPSPTKPRFPRFSRDSSASEPPLGTPRRRKSTIIEKIKHIFSHEKHKGEKHKVEKHKK